MARRRFRKTVAVLWWAATILLVFGFVASLVQVARGIIAGGADAMRAKVAFVALFGALLYLQFRSRQRDKSR